MKTGNGKGNADDLIRKQSARNYLIIRLTKEVCGIQYLVVGEVVDPTAAGKRSLSVSVSGTGDEVPDVGGINHNYSA